MSTNSHSCFFVFFCVCASVYFFLGGGSFSPPGDWFCSFNLSQQKVFMDFVCKGGEKKRT